LKICKVSSERHSASIRKHWNRFQPGLHSGVHCRSLRRSSRPLVHWRGDIAFPLVDHPSTQRLRVSWSWRDAFNFSTSCLPRIKILVTSLSDNSRQRYIILLQSLQRLF